VIDQEQTKEALKEALKEWLDEKFATFGKWAFMSVAAALLVALIGFMLQMNGWTPPAK
jgi:hypothetical protein